jgi:hypothetical protein
VAGFGVASVWMNMRARDLAGALVLPNARGGSKSRASLE